MLILYSYSQSRLQTFAITFLFLELIKTCWFNEECVIRSLFYFFFPANKLNTFKLLNKNKIIRKRIMVLCRVVNFEKTLTHCCNAFIEYSVFHITFLIFSYSVGERSNGNKACYIYNALLSLLMTKNFSVKV